MQNNPHAGLSELNAAQIENAVRFVLWSVRRCGYVPMVSRHALQAAARITHLMASDTSWLPCQAIEPYLEAAGFDRDGNIVDYEKFYAHREAYEHKRVAKKRRRKVL